MRASKRSAGPSGHGGVDAPDAREVEFVRVGDEAYEVRVTSRHLRVAKALHAALPIVIPPVGQDGIGAPPCRVDWDGAPFHHKLDLLELAHIALLAAEP